MSDEGLASVLDRVKRDHCQKTSQEIGTEIVNIAHRGLALNGSPALIICDIAVKGIQKGIDALFEATLNYCKANGTNPQEVLTQTDGAVSSLIRIIARRLRGRELLGASRNVEETGGRLAEEARNAALTGMVAGEVIYRHVNSWERYIKWVKEDLPRKIVEWAVIGFLGWLVGLLTFWFWGS